jgi:hypothetical protein
MAPLALHVAPSWHWRYAAADHDKRRPDQMEWISFAARWFFTNPRNMNAVSEAAE